ncbi:MAG: M81 family metallopeptidase [Planctomycetes bacterium]|nr:M81 family metallopeptidase [Planctomycetota bacterium]
MRIAIGQIWQETNTFNPLATTRADFEAFGIVSGPGLIEQMQHTNELGGFIQAIRKWPIAVEILGIARFPAWPSGPASESTFDWLARAFMEHLEPLLPLDAVLLALHGAMSADGHADVEGEILERVRQKIGLSIPLVATLDLHANITQRMARNADALVLYHTAPHIDVFETGVRGAELLRRILLENAQPRLAFVKVPAVYPVERANTQAPTGISHELKIRLEELEQRPGVLTAGIATVQPWLDIPDLGSATLVVTDGQVELADSLARELADTLWSRRREYLSDLVPLDQAVARARQQTHGLVVLSDPADATTSGAPGDSVWLLEELLKYDWPRPVLTTVVAAPIVAEAERLGIDQRFQGTIGGVRDTRFGKSIPIDARVAGLFDARFVLNGHLGRNLSIDMGRSAVLEIGPVKVIVTARSGPHFAPELFQAAGFDPYAASVVVAKSPCGFRAVYERQAAEIISVSAPGCAPPEFWHYPYSRIPRPLWPWDEFEWYP